MKTQRQVSLNQKSHIDHFIVQGEVRGLIFFWLDPRQISYVTQKVAKARQSPIAIPHTPVFLRSDLVPHKCLPEGQMILLVEPQAA